MIRLFMVALLFFASPAAAETAGRLLGERTHGAERLCIYEVPNAVLRGELPQRQRQVGLGEPCPRFDPGDRLTPVRTVPSLATLAGERQVSKQRFCVYAYQGRRYERPVRPAQYCPMTPYFLD